MRKFDLEAANAGARVVTRGGDTVRVIAHVPDATNEYDRVVFMHDGSVSTCRDDGRQLEDRESGLDLFMADAERKISDAECVEFIKAARLHHQIAFALNPELEIARYAIRERERAARILREKAERQEELTNLWDASVASAKAEAYADAAEIVEREGKA